MRSAERRTQQNCRVDAAAPNSLTPDQQQWLRRSEALWQRAHRSAEAHPEHDVSDLYHALRHLELTPSERLGLGLSRARLRPHKSCTAHGLGTFGQEYAGASDRAIDGVPVRVLPLHRIVAIKRATNRPKDRAALPILEATLLARRDGEVG